MSETFKDMLSIKRIAGMVSKDFDECTAADLEECSLFLQGERDKLAELHEIVEKAYMKKLRSEHSARVKQPV